MCLNYILPSSCFIRGSAWNSNGNQAGLLGGDSAIRRGSPRTDVILVLYRSVGMPKLETIHVSNPSASQLLHLNSISGDSPVFHASFFKSKVGKVLMRLSLEELNINCLLTPYKVLLMARLLWLHLHNYP